MLKAKVEKGGRIAVHEIDDATDFTAKPEVELFFRMNAHVLAALRAALARYQPRAVVRLVKA